MKRSALWKLSTIALAVIAIPSPVRAVAHPTGSFGAASTVSCGDTITTDTKLANDLIDCPGDGLVIGADDITLDLGGHVIDGDGQGEDEAIDNTAGHDRVTIRNGSVRQFVEGVLVVGASADRVRGVRAHDLGHAGIFFDRVDGGLIADSSTPNDLAGIVITRSHDVRVERNVASYNAFSGIVIFESRDVVIADNRLRRNGPDSPAIGLFRDADANRVVGNLVSRTSDGIHVGAGCDRNVIRGNRAVRNGGGIILEPSGRNVVVGNVATGNAFVGIGVAGGEGTRIVGNTVRGNGLETAGAEGGIHLLLSSDRNVVAGNVVVGNGPDGILIDGDQRQNFVRRNRTNANTDDGIDIESPATTVANNTANRNGDLGIEAVRGVTDGGGNEAEGNGDPRQCLNVRCS